MFSTQLAGLFKRLQEKEAFAIEDSARLLAQAAASNGKIYVFGTKEMSGVGYEATQSEEPMRDAVIWEKEAHTDHISETDRFIIFSRNSDDEEAVDLAKTLEGKGVPFVAVSTDNAVTDIETLAGLADVHIDLKLTKGLLPDEEGNRFGYPASMAALFVYYGIKFTIEEILAEYE